MARGSDETAAFFSKGTGSIAATSANESEGVGFCIDAVVVAGPGASAVVGASCVAGVYGLVCCRSADDCSCAAVAFRDCNSAGEVESAADALELPASECIAHSVLFALCL